MNELVIQTPCIVIHTERTQVPRFAEEIKKQFDNISLCIDGIASPLIYARNYDDNNTSMPKLRQQLYKRLGNHRISPHRIYQLDYTCLDPGWIPKSFVLRHLKVNEKELSMRVVAFPSQFQVKLISILTCHGFHVHPTKYNYELHAVMQSHVHSMCYFGIVSIDNNPLAQAMHIASSTKELDHNIPCRAYYKLQEAIKFVPFNGGEFVLDIGAAPGGWTKCLVDNGARVVAVDPGDLTIATASHTVYHIQALLEVALPELKAMDLFDMIVCDINTRVAMMANLVLQIVSRLKNNGLLICTLKLGKKPTNDAVAKAILSVKGALSGYFHEFQIHWLHANTENERTLIAVKKTIQFQD